MLVFLVRLELVIGVSCRDHCGILMRILIVAPLYSAFNQFAVQLSLLLLDGNFTKFVDFDVGIFSSDKSIPHLFS